MWPRSGFVTETRREIVVNSAVSISRPVLAIRCEKQARVSPRPKGSARVQAHGHEETWPPGMPLAHELSSSPIQEQLKATSRSRARFTRG